MAKKKYKSSFKSTSDMYRAKNRDRKRRGAAVGCMTIIVQAFSFVALTALALITIF